MMHRSELEKVDSRIAWALESGTASPWLKAALRGALGENPVEVAADVEVLRNLLQSRADAWLQAELGPVPTPDPR